MTDEKINFVVHEIIDLGNAACNVKALNKLRIVSDYFDRCPHDGGRCGRGCMSSCFREDVSASLSCPWDGYPIDSKNFFIEKVLKTVLES